MVECKYPRMVLEKSSPSPSWRPYEIAGIWGGTQSKTLRVLRVGLVLGLRGLRGGGFEGSLNPLHSNHTPSSFFVLNPL